MRKRKITDCLKMVGTVIITAVLLILSDNDVMISALITLISVLLSLNIFCRYAVINSYAQFIWVTIFIILESFFHIPFYEYRIPIVIMLTVIYFFYLIYYSGEPLPDRDWLAAGLSVLLSEMLQSAFYLRVYENGKIYIAFIAIGCIISETVQKLTEKRFGVHYPISDIKISIEGIICGTFTSVAAMTVTGIVLTYCGILEIGSVIGFILFSIAVSVSAPMGDIFIRIMSDPMRDMWKKQEILIRKAHKNIKPGRYLIYLNKSLCDKLGGFIFALPMALILTYFISVF